VSGDFVVVVDHDEQVQLSEPRQLMACLQHENATAMVRGAEAVRGNKQDPKAFPSGR